MIFSPTGTSARAAANRSRGAVWRTPSWAVRAAGVATTGVVPGGGGAAEGGSLGSAGLGWAGCGRRYDVRLAGRCLDDPGLHLEPIPLLADAVDVQERQGLGQRSIVKIALPSAVG